MGRVICRVCTVTDTPCTMSTNRNVQAKNRAPASIQITAEQILREAKDRQLDVEVKAPRQQITDEEELRVFRMRKRKEVCGILGLILMLFGRVQGRGFSWSKRMYALIYLDVLSAVTARESSVLLHGELCGYLHTAGSAYRH